MAVRRSQQIVDVFNKIFGLHKGYRAVHAKGQFLKGRFTATPIAAQLTCAVHMQGDPVQVTARFSNGSGNPFTPDFLPDVRGLSVSFHLPNGGRTDIVAATLPRFPVQTPGAFIALAKATEPGLALLWRFPLFVCKHPEFLTALPANATAFARLPAGYGSVLYYAIHAYKWIAPDGCERYVRYRWVPERKARLSWWNALLQGSDYLQSELRRHLQQQPIRFALRVQIAEPGDVVDDPTAVWSEECEMLTVGTLELTALDDECEKDGKTFVFDPVRVTGGIALSKDPILHFRTHVYRVSATQRENS